MLLLQTLQTHQFPIPPFERHEIAMRPTLSHLALLNEIDHIHVLDRAQSVRDSDRGPALRRHIQRILDHSLGIRVKRRGCFVEKQDLLIAKQGSCCSNALFLTAG